MENLPQLYLPNAEKVLEHWMVRLLIVEANESELALLLTYLKAGLENLPSEKEELDQDEYEFYCDLYAEYIKAVNNGLKLIRKV